MVNQPICFEDVLMSAILKNAHYELNTVDFQWQYNVAVGQAGAAKGVSMKL